MSSGTNPKTKATAKQNRTAGPSISRGKTAPAKERVLVEFPLPLLRRTEAAAAQLALDRSKFIRAAVEEKVWNMEREKIEEELATAYAANSEFDLKVCGEFKHADGEQAR